MIFYHQNTLFHIKNLNTNKSYKTYENVAILIDFCRKYQKKKNKKIFN